MESLSVTGTSGNSRLIGGIAIEPTVVQGTDPTAAITLGDQIGETQAVTKPMDTTGSPALPVQPASEPVTESKTSDSTGTPAKRPRGRPRKNPVKESPVKRGRGRPRRTEKLAETSNGVVSESTGGKCVGSERSGQSITDTDYNPSCIDKLMEDMISKKATPSKTPEKVKRPVGRPRKRPLDAKQPVKSKKFKGEASAAEGNRPRMLDNLFAIMPQEDEPSNMPLLLTTNVKPETSKMQISKEMVDKMISKMKSGQGSEGEAKADPSSASKAEVQDERQKRGRGRPKKGEEKVTVTMNESPTTKKRRGRPKKTASGGSEPVTATESPAQSQDSPDTKKKRGRPKRVAPAEEGVTAVAPAAENGESSPAKRKRGRPRKIPPAVPSEPVQENADPVISELPAEETQVIPSQEAVPPGDGFTVETEDSEQDVMGKLQVSFSESESECSDPMDVPRSTIDALTHRVAPPFPLNTAPLNTAPQQSNAPLFVDNQFEESFDEDSDN